MKAPLEGLSPIILAGPSAVGKSALANTLQYHGDAEVVTADKYYLYAGENFCLGLGLIPEELQREQAHYLFGSLQPTDPLPTAGQYLELLTGAVEQVHAAGRLAVIEGCSFSYTMAAIRHFGVEHAVRLSLSSLPVDLEQLIGQAVRGLVAAGLYEETERALKAGYKRTYPMSSVIYRSAIQVVEGVLSAAEAEHKITQAWQDSSYRTDKRFAAVAGLLPVNPFSDRLRIE